MNRSSSAEHLLRKVSTNLLPTTRAAVSAVAAIATFRTSSAEHFHCKRTTNLLPTIQAAVTAGAFATVDLT